MTIRIRIDSIDATHLGTDSPPRAIEVSLVDPLAPELSRDVAPAAHIDSGASAEFYVHNTQAVLVREVPL